MSLNCQLRTPVFSREIDLWKCHCSVSEPLLCYGFRQRKLFSLCLLSQLSECCCWGNVFVEQLTSIACHLQSSCQIILLLQWRIHANVLRKISALKRDCMPSQFVTQLGKLIACINSDRLHSLHACWRGCRHFRRSINSLLSVHVPKKCRDYTKFVCELYPKRAVPRLSRWTAGFLQRRSWFDSRVIWDFLRIEQRLSLFSSSISPSRSNSHSTNPCVH
jgi:hypothetical protein